MFRRTAVCCTGRPAGQWTVNIRMNIRLTKPSIAEQQLLFSIAPHRRNIFASLHPVPMLHRYPLFPAPGRDSYEQQLLLCAGGGNAGFRSRPCISIRGKLHERGDMMPPLYARPALIFSNALCSSVLGRLPYSSIWPS